MPSTTITAEERTAENMYVNGMLTNKGQIPAVAAILAAERRATVERIRARLQSGYAAGLDSRFIYTILDEEAAR